VSSGPRISEGDPGGEGGPSTSPPPSRMLSLLKARSLTGPVVDPVVSIVDGGSIIY